jgi:uncharacterized Fe-S cluster protein YjdI/CDGSH-type Zn-finger protein
MARKKAYEANGIVVHFEAKRCIHAGACVRGLPAVFDVDKRPWIDPDRASAAEIADIVHRCPSGALTYERLDGGPPEPVFDGPPTVRTATNGPLFVRGRVEITDHAGVTVCVEPRVALCRCGASRNKPFCDNSHRSVGFKDPV